MLCESVSPFSLVSVNTDLTSEHRPRRVWSRLKACQQMVDSLTTCASFSFASYGRQHAHWMAIVY